MSERIRLNSSLVLSAVAVTLACLVVLSGAAAVLGAAFGGGAGRSNPSQAMNRLATEHDQLMQVYRQRFDGRSIFFPPPPRPKPRTDDAPAPTPPPPVDTGPPPPPSTYTGPSVLFVVGETVFFKSPTSDERQMWINVGDEKSGVKVIALDMPWAVKLGHKGGTYEIKLFPTRDTEKGFATAAKNRQMPRGLQEVTLAAAPRSANGPAPAAQDETAAAQDDGEQDQADDDEAVDTADEDAEAESAPPEPENVDDDADEPEEPGAGVGEADSKPAPSPRPATPPPAPPKV